MESNEDHISRIKENTKPKTATLYYSPFKWLEIKTRRKIALLLLLQAVTGKNTQLGKLQTFHLKTFRYIIKALWLINSITLRKELHLQLSTPYQHVRKMSQRPKTDARGLKKLDEESPRLAPKNKLDANGNYPLLKGFQNDSR